ncbi:hypothetical protein SRIMHP_22810 [Streptomyces rimosus subsp. rimosus]|uniref:Uncharacterized protein n=1 Tax=Streptomyces rimosus subsp. rimosus TaxID=132474 RepID=A0ABY3Z5W2_STRRM|nr:hypothetical protein SRIMR7_25440 [Streptomyces rimosus subsp. rimosus]UTH96959.1 hypothetical protein SRIMHP_22810 [Streptomyces rimosus subsp. rimosus]UTJ15055.1 hypothetical protein SRIMDV3_22700 [Streptomyces rimosus subsp. rimosus]
MREPSRGRRDEVNDGADGDRCDTGDTRGC